MSDNVPTEWVYAIQYRPTGSVKIGKSKNRRSVVTRIRTILNQLPTYDADRDKQRLREIAMGSRGSRTAVSDSGNGKQPDLIPQKHGGALLSGGKPGNKGGLGARTSSIKKQMREIVEEGLPQLREYVIGERKQSMKKVVSITCPECEHAIDAEVEVEFIGPPTAKDQLRAMEIAAKHGLDETVDKGLVDELWGAIEDLVPEAQQAKVKHQFNLIVGRRLAEAVVT